VSVRVRLALAFLAVSLLIPLVGVLAVREQYAASQRAATAEARHVAEPIAHTIANTAELTGGDRGQLYHDQERLQEYLDDLQRDLHRHMEIIDPQQRVLAAATPGKEKTRTRPRLGRTPTPRSPRPSATASPAPSSNATRNTRKAPCRWSSRCAANRAASWARW